MNFTCILPDNYAMVDIRPLGVLALDCDSNIAYMKGNGMSLGS